MPKEEGGLGFREGWRLLQAPESLCAQVLRAKYFQMAMYSRQNLKQVCALIQSPIKYLPYKTHLGVLLFIHNMVDTNVHGKAR